MCAFDKLVWLVRRFDVALLGCTAAAGRRQGGDGGGGSQYQGGGDGCRGAAYQFDCGWSGHPRLGGTPLHRSFYFRVSASLQKCAFIFGQICQSWPSAQWIRTADGRVCLGRSPACLGSLRMTPESIILPRRLNMSALLSEADPLGSKAPSCGYRP